MQGSLKRQILQFRLTLIVSAVLGFLFFVFVFWKSLEFSMFHLSGEAQFLTAFTDRAVSRYRANPNQYREIDPTTGSRRSFGNERLDMLLSYDALKSRFPDIPPEDQLRDGEIELIVQDLRGFFRVPDCLIIRPTFLSSEEKFYAYLLVESALNDAFLDFRLFEELEQVFAFALMSLFLLLLFQIYQLSQVNSTITHFAQWTDELVKGKTLPVPEEIKNSKFSTLAQTFNKSIGAINDVLEKEQSFAKFTSHELRTPIAALSVNMEVLELLMENLSEDERAVLKNMETAIADMKYQTEALLWLSRETLDDLEYKDCDLKVLIEKSINDNRYLITEKSVEVSVIGEPTLVRSQIVLSQIVLNNIVRNAFQNTNKGMVDITLEKNRIDISNVDASKEEGGRSDIGFGIGLVLVDKLVTLLDIDYSVEMHPGGRKVTLVFN